MKNRYSILAAALFLFLAPGCEDKSSGTSRQLEELERKANEALDRQLELEQQLEEQKTAVEREAIERERMLIKEERLELERQQDEAAAAEAEALRQREQELANREGKLQQIQSDLEKKEARLADRGMELNERDRELAGREAIPFEANESTVPVADYGMFYDSLSSYGSWYETLDYGYVWQPAVVSDSNWRPYSRGRWVCSDRGWTWVSEEPFGWATYHFGRWALIRGRGWVWVPGTEWAPCWVSWRESGSHIGWAPLPPETMAYRNHRWDSTVDEQFGIGAASFNFVEIRHFGGPLYQHCLPVSRNSHFIKGTRNITYVHLVNRQVICGGPQYQKINKRLGRPIPFYRLELEGRARQSREGLGMRPRIKGDRLMVSAPNMDAAWNEGLRPSRVRERIDKLEVERREPLRPEITDRFKKNREEGQRIARRSMEEFGGPERFKQGRVERLEENRKQVEKMADRPVKQRDLGKSSDRTPREQAKRVDRPTGNRVAEETLPANNPDRSRDSRERARPLERDPRVKQQETSKQPQSPRTQETRAEVSGLKNKDAVPKTRKPEEPRDDEQDKSVRKSDEGPRALQMDALRKRQAEQETQRQEKQAIEQQQKERQRDQAREAARQQQEMQREEQKSREAREQVIEEQRQRDEAREAARQEQAEQQQEMQRQQERAKRELEEQQQESERQQEEARRQQQQESERQQEEARRQQQQESERQQEEARRQQRQESERQQERSRQREREESQRQQDRERQQEESRRREREETQRQQDRAKKEEDGKARNRDSERARNR